MCTNLEKFILMGCNFFFFYSLGDFFQKEKLTYHNSRTTSRTNWTLVSWWTLGKKKNKLYMYCTNDLTFIIFLNILSKFLPFFAKCNP